MDIYDYIYRRKPNISIIKNNNQSQSTRTYNDIDLDKLNDRCSNRKWCESENEKIKTV